VRRLRFLVFLFVIGGVLWNVLPLPSRTLTFAEQNCACKIPYNWTVKDNPLFLLEAHRPYGGSFFLKAQKATPQFSVENPVYAQEVKAKVQSDGYEVVNESRDLFQGRPAYAYTMRKVINGKLVYLHSISFVAGQSRYLLEAAKEDSDPIADSQLKAAIDSFSLITPSPN
jgi:hypothetical protein